MTQQQTTLPQDGMTQHGWPEHLLKWLQRRTWVQVKSEGSLSGLPACQTYHLIACYMEYLQFLGGQLPVDLKYEQETNSNHAHESTCEEQASTYVCMCVSVLFTLK